MRKYSFDKKEHLHKLDGRPLTGTSSVTAVLSKPLTWWASGLAVGKLGWINSKKKVEGRYVSVPKEERLESVSKMLAIIKNFTPDQFLELLDEAYKAHSTSLTDSAGKGVDMHADLEKYVKDCIRNSQGLPIPPTSTEVNPVYIFSMWALENVNKFIASEAHTFSEALWVGGIIDTLAEMKNGNLAVIDFKSSKEAYVSQFIQAAGYAIQIEENGLISADGRHTKRVEKEIKELIIIPFGAEEVVPEVRTNVEEYKKGFESALMLYRILGMDEKIKNN